MKPQKKTLKRLISPAERNVRQLPICEGRPLKYVR
jgi:hypothetical protein